MIVAMVTVASLAVGGGWFLVRRGMRSGRPIAVRRTYRYRLPGEVERLLCVVTGDLRRVRGIEVWVNPENTSMRMARVDEFSVSAIVRYEGARKDATGRITADVVAEELDRLVGGQRPVPAGTVIVTRAGGLARFGVRQLAHVAAVHGELGSGYRQVRDVGRCVMAVLGAVDGVGVSPPLESVLFPLLGVGQGRGDPGRTALAVAGAVVDYFAAMPDSSVREVFVLAYTEAERVLCRRACRKLGLPSAGMTLTASRAEELADDPVPEPPGKTLHIGFSVDVVGFGRRSAPERDAVQQRLAALLRKVLSDVGINLDLVCHEWHGDGASVYLPNDVDPSRALPALVTATARRLTEDNRSHGDRIRLRMALASGLVGPGVAGYSGPLPVELARMIDAGPLRHALAEDPTRDLGVLLSDYLYTHVFRLGYEHALAPLRRVEVAVKEYAATAWLWSPDC